MEKISVQEKEDALMVSPTGEGHPFQKTAYFLKPILPNCSITKPHLKLPSSLPFRFEPNRWPLEVQFHGWRERQEVWSSWVDLLAPLHHSTWKRAGIYEAIISSKYQIRRKTDVLYGLAEKWCPETNTFMFPWGEATVTLEDVMVLRGFSVLGDSIFRPLESNDLKQVEEKMVEARKQVARAMPSGWLKIFMKSGSELEHEAFLAFWLSRYVFHDLDRSIQKRVFPIAIHLARGTRFALAQPVLASVYNDMSLLRKAIVASNELKSGDGVLKLNLKSPLQLVQVWVWERFMELRPRPNSIRNSEPRLSRWNKVHGLKVENMRRVLNSAGEAFMWRPYAMVVENWRFPEYYMETGKTVLVGDGLKHDEDLLSFSICLRVTEVVGFDTCKLYLPHRVAMQFGYDQDTPGTVARSNHSTKHCIMETEVVRLYVPSRLAEPDLSARYLKWWKASLLRAKRPNVPSGLSSKKDLQPSKERKRKRSSWLLQSPPDTIVEEKEEFMISPTGGRPFLKIAHFLKPISPSSIDKPYLTKFPTESYPSPPTHFEPTKWPLEIAFCGWSTEVQEEWKAWVDRLASLHQSIWKKAGIYEAILNSVYEIRRKNDLVYAVADKWCSQTNTFIFPWGEATITLEDVMILGGYSVLGDPVFSPVESTEMKEIELKLNEKRSEVLRSLSKNARTSLWLKKFMNSGCELEHEAFLVMWLSKYVFPDTYRTIQKRVFSIAIHLARGTRIALAPAVLSSIYKDLSSMKCAIVDSSKINAGCDGAIKLSIKSPFQYVQLWAWERFGELIPNPGVINLGQPRSARWDKVNGVEVENLRRVLDSAGDDFKWRPYSMTIQNWQLPKYYPEVEMHVPDCYGIDNDLLSFFRCLRATELSGFGTIEQYLPHRVSMQFGFDQDIPCVVARSNQSSDIAWNHYIKEIGNASLYIPSRLSEADVSTKYMEWFKASVSVLQEESKAPMPSKAKAEKSVMGSKRRMKLVQNSEGRNDGNDSHFLPELPHECDRMEAGDHSDEDNITISKILKRSRKDADLGKIVGGNRTEELSGQVDITVSPLRNRMEAADHSDEDNITISEILKRSRKDANLGKIVGGNRTEELSGQVDITVSPLRNSDDMLSIMDHQCDSSSFLSEKRISELKARVNILEMVVGKIKEISSNLKFDLEKACERKLS